MENVMWFALIAICFVAYTVAVYEHGGNMRVKRYWVPAVAAPKVDTVTPARFSVETSPATGVIALPFIEHAITVPIEIVPTTSSLLVLPSAAVHEATQLEAAQARIAELESVIAAKDESHAEQVEAITAKFNRAEHLRKFHLHGKRLAAARYSAVVGMTFEKKRRTSCEAALATVVDISTARHRETAKVITPLIHQRWLETDLIGAAA